MPNNSSIFNFDDYYNEAETLALLNITKNRLKKLVEMDEIKTTRNKFAMQSKTMYLKSDVERLIEELAIVQEHYTVAQLARKFNTSKQRLHYLIKVHNLPTETIHSKLLSGKDKIFIKKDVSKLLYELHKNVDESRFKFLTNDYYNDDFNVYLYQQFVDTNGLPYRVVKVNDVWGVMTSYDVFIPVQDAIKQFQLVPISTDTHYFNNPKLISLKFEVGSLDKLYPVIDFFHHYLGPNNVKLKTHGESIHLKVTYEPFEIDCTKYNNVLKIIQQSLTDGILNSSNNCFDVLKIDTVCNSLMKKIPLGQLQLLNEIAAKQDKNLDTLLVDLVNNFINDQTSGTREE